MTTNLFQTKCYFSLKPETLQSALSDDEYDAFLERYPDYLSESEASSSENDVDETMVSDEHDSVNSTETSESLKPVVQESETFKDIDDEIETLKSTRLKLKTCLTLTTFNL